VSKPPTSVLVALYKEISPATVAVLL
jgi:hypothetical protein